MILTGSIDLSAVPKELFKKIKSKTDGRERIFLNISVVERKAPATFGERAYTHFVSCRPKEENRVEGQNYIIGDLSAVEWRQPPTPEEVASAPSVGTEDDLPF